MYDKPQNSQGSNPRPPENKRVFVTSGTGLVPSYFLFRAASSVLAELRVV
jgi:hypothetical protein